MCNHNCPATSKWPVVGSDEGTGEHASSEISSSSAFACVPPLCGRRSNQGYSDHCILQGRNVDDAESTDQGGLGADEVENFGHIRLAHFSVTVTQKLHQAWHPLRLASFVLLWEQEYNTNSTVRR